MSFLQIEDLHMDLGEFRLRGVSLDVEKGRYMTVVGPTGAGKTVLLECIIGFFEPDRGRVVLDGRDITDDPPERRGIGIVYQDYALLPHKTAGENIGFGLRKCEPDPKKRNRRVDDLARVLNISHILHRRPGTLSGGEQQRVALARALAVRPALLLMDEPLSALDPDTRATARKLLRETVRSHGTTVIHITHDMDDVRDLADCAAVIRDGQLERQGEPEQVLAVLSPVVAGG